MLRIAPPDINASCYAKSEKAVGKIRCYTNGIAQWLLNLTGHAVNIKSEHETYCINRSSLARFITEQFQHPDVDNKQFRKMVLSLIDRAIEKGEIKTDTDLSSFIELILSRANVPLDATKQEILVAELTREKENSPPPIQNFVEHALDDLKTPTAQKMTNYNQTLKPLQEARVKIKEVSSKKESLITRANHLVQRAEQQALSTEKLVLAKNRLEELFSSPPGTLSIAQLNSFVAEVLTAVITLEEQERLLSSALVKKEVESVRLDVEQILEEIENKFPQMKETLQPYRHELRDLEALKEAFIALQAIKKEAEHMALVTKQKEECQHILNQLKEHHAATATHLQRLLEELPTHAERDSWLQKASHAVEKALEELSLIERLAKRSGVQDEAGPVFAQELKKKAQENKVKKTIAEMKQSFSKVVSEKTEEMQQKRLKEVAGDLSRCVASFCDGVKDQPAICQGCLKDLLEGLATTIETQKGNFSKVALRKAFPLVESISTSFISQFKGTSGIMLREVFLDVLNKMPSVTTGAVREFAKAMHEKMQLSQSVIDVQQGDLVEQISMWAELCLNHPSQSQAAFERLIGSIETQEQVGKICKLISLKCQMAQEKGENLLDDLKIYLYLVKRNLISSSESFKTVCALFENALGFQPKPVVTLDRTSSHLSFLFSAAPEESQTACRIQGVPLETVAEASLELGLQKLTAEGSTHPVFIGTEWAFMSDSPEKMYQTLNRLSQISRKYPHVTFMPGSIAWFQKIHRESYACFNTLPVFENGRLVALYHKRYEKMDLDTIANVFKKKRGTLSWALSDPTTKEQLLDYNSNLMVSGKGQLFAFEICNDHINLAAQDDYVKRAATGLGADVHVLMAHGSILNNVRTCTHNGSLVAYIDHSTSAQTSLATLQIAKGNEERINKEKRQDVNQNFGLVGAFKAHCYPAKASLEPAYLDHPEGESSPNVFFEVLARQLGTTAEELKQKLIQHLRANEKSYYPQETLPLPKQWTAASFQDFQKRILQTYTFNSKDDLHRAIEAIQQGTGDLRELAPILLSLTSELLSRQIVLNSDLANFPTQVFDPHRKKPHTPSPNALQVNFSYKDAMFY